MQGHVCRLVGAKIWNKFCKVNEYLILNLERFTRLSISKDCGNLLKRKEFICELLGFPRRRFSDEKPGTEFKKVKKEPVKPNFPIII